MHTINISASDLAKLTGDNTYEPFENIVEKILVNNKLLNKYIPKSNLERFIMQLSYNQRNQIIAFMELPKKSAPFVISKAIVSRYVYPSFSKEITELQSKQLIDINLPPILSIMNSSIKKDLQIRRGNIKELGNIGKYENKFKRKVTERNSKLFQKVLYIDPDGKFRIVVRGRVDGISEEDSCIIESKNRSRYLFKKLRPYERVQIEAYMFLSGMQRCILTEYYNEESFEIDYSHDDAYWNECCGKIIYSIRCILKSGPSKLGE